MWSTVILVLISIVNSMFLSLTIWAGLQLRNHDWWVVFMVIFIIGTAYEVEYFRRNITSIVTPDQATSDIELEEPSRLPAARIRAVRSTQGPGTNIPQTSVSTSRRDETMSP